MKRVALVLDREQPIRVSFTKTEAIITAGGGGGDIAEGREFVECHLSGDDVTIAFNPHFLLDGLSAVDAPVTVVSMTSSGKPAVFGGAAEIDGKAIEEFKYLLMPIRQQ